MKQTDKSTAASLRIFCSKCAAEEISKRLSMTPTRAYSTGEPVGPRTPGIFRQTSMWSLESPLTQTAELSAHLEWLLDFIEARISIIRSIQEDCKIDIFCLFASESAQGGTTFTSQLLARLAEARLDLRIDLCPPVSPNEDYTTVQVG
jgi:hypothetical protein